MHLPSHRRLRTALAFTSVALAGGSAAAHTIDCTGRSGIDLARCERHQKMAERCGPIKGDAHFACDREFLLANPLRCDALTGDDQKRCAAEAATIQRCEPQAGRDFLRCVSDTLKASPMGGS